MTSAEPARTTAYSPDIGWRVVWQRIGIGLTFKEIAIRLQIGVGTAHRLYARYVDTGDAVPKMQPARPDSRKIDNLHELYIIALIHENPAIYLHEICAKIVEATGITVSGSNCVQGSMGCNPGQQVTEEHLWPTFCNIPVTSWCGWMRPAV